MTTCAPEYPEDFVLRRMVTARGDCLELRVAGGVPRKFVNGNLVAKGGDGAEYLKTTGGTEGGAGD